MYHNRSIIALLLVCLIAIFSTNIFAEDSQNWDEATPAQIHQKLWESKSAAMMDRQISKSLAAANPEANTQTNYDVIFYDIAMRLNDTTQVIFGNVKTVALAAENNLSEVQIDLFDNMTIDSIVALNGTHLSYSRASNVVTVTLESVLSQGSQFGFNIYYYGHPVTGGFQAFAFTSYNGATVMASLSEPYFARTWWPCKDRMDDKADSFKIAIEVEISMFVGSNGVLDSLVRNSGNSHTYYYHHNYPMATYLFSVAASDYMVWYDEWPFNGGLDTLPIVNAVFPSRYAYSLGKLDVTPEALTNLSEYFGPYPFPDEKYGHSNFTWGGAMEHQTMTSTSYSDFGFSEPVVVHELGHQWWGDLVTCKEWGHIWLNEGWASYSEAVHFLAKYGWSYYQSYMNGMDYTGGGLIYIEDTTEVGNIFSSIVYDKGAWVCHMLRGVLGEQKFAEGIEAYYNSEYSYGAATTEEFRDVFEASSGVELDWFFEDWIYGTYRPNYRYSYFQQPSDSGGYDLYLKVDQRQTTAPVVFRMPVDFAFTRTGSSVADTLTLKCDERNKVFHLNFPTEVTNIEIDPYDWVLKYSSTTSWSILVITTQDDISDGIQYHNYNDTVHQVGAENTTTYVFTGSLPPGIILGNDGVLSGVPTDTGSYTFSFQYSDASNGKYELVTMSIDVAPSPYLPGDFNLDNQPDISDLLFLVDYMFVVEAPFPPAPPHMDAGDFNDDCQIDITDLLIMVDYMFLLEQPALTIGCE